MRKTKPNAGFLGTISFAVKYKKEFTEFVQRQRKCIEVPEYVAKVLDPFAEQRQAVEHEIASISSINTLETMITVQNNETRGG